MSGVHGTIDYFAYSADLEVAGWDVPLDVAVLRYHRLALAMPRVGEVPVLTVVPDPAADVPGLVFRLGWGDLARAAALAAHQEMHALDRVLVRAPGDRLFFARTHRTSGPIAPANRPFDGAGHLRALYDRHGVNRGALESALAVAVRDAVRSQEEAGR